MIAAMTASDLIDTLGGNRKVAALFGVRSSAVSNWRALGRFPARLHYRISKVCEERGVEVDERLFDEPQQQAVA